MACLRKNNEVSLLNNLTSVVTHVLYLYVVEIYKIACVIWDRVGDSTQMRTALAPAYSINSLLYRSDCRCAMRSYEEVPVCVLLTLTVAGCSWSCVLWWWYSPLGLLYSEIPRPQPPFRDYSNWSLPLTCNPIERKRLLYLTVKTLLYVPLYIRAVYHICSVAFETNEVLSSP